MTSDIKLVNRSMDLAALWWKDMSTENLPVIFVRHMMDANRSMFKKWFHTGLAVLHYEEQLSDDKKMSVDPKDFDGTGRKILGRLWDYCKSGALVVVDYDHYGFKNILIGTLPANSVVKPIEEKLEPSPNYPNGLAHYQMVELKDCVRLHYSDSWVRPLLILQPRQGNVVHWTKGKIDVYVKNLYKAILDRASLSPNLKLNNYPFTDYQWDVLCAEYLRTVSLNNMRIDYLLTPVGETVKNVDIEGANKDFYVSAQVSLTTDLAEVDRKIANLLICSQNPESKTKKTTLVYFGPIESKKHVEKNNVIIFVSIDDVLEKLKTIGIIEDMIPNYDD